VGIDWRETESTYTSRETLLNNAKGTPEGKGERKHGTAYTCNDNP